MEKLASDECCKGKVELEPIREDNQRLPVWLVIIRGGLTVRKIPYHKNPRIRHQVHHLRF